MEKFMKDNTFARKTVAQKEKSFQALIELGCQGHFPLFYPEWINQSCQKANVTKLKKSETKKMREILRRLSRYTNIERKRTVLLTLPAKDRQIFIKAFLNLVEDKILEKELELQ